MTRVLSQRSSVELVAVVRTPAVRVGSARARLARLYRYNGLPGVYQLPLRKLTDLGVRIGRSLRPRKRADLAMPLSFDNFHSADCLAALRALDLDVLVVDGTYVLRESVFSIPRRVTLNLHCGKLPEYRGAPPCFWELYNGESEVGVTIHGINADLDAGPIYNQRLFPLEQCPRGPAVQYAHDMWLGVLRPAGVELMALTLEQIANGTATPRAQTVSHRPYRRPHHKMKSELQARVDARCPSNSVHGDIDDGH